jgi:hypothetical protein
MRFAQYGVKPAHFDRWALCAIAATHGSGDHNGSLATSVICASNWGHSGRRSRRFIARSTAGSVAGVIVGLGGLGVVTCPTPRRLPSFQMRHRMSMKICHWRR